MVSKYQPSKMLVGVKVMYDKIKIFYYFYGAIGHKNTKCPDLRRQFTILGDHIEGIEMTFAPWVESANVEEKVISSHHQPNPTLHPLWQLNHTTPNAGRANYKYSINIVKSSQSLGSYNEHKNGLRWWKLFK